MKSILSIKTYNNHRYFSFQFYTLSNTDSSDIFYLVTLGGCNSRSLKHHSHCGKVVEQSRSYRYKFCTNSRSHPYCNHLSQYTLMEQTFVNSPDTFLLHLLCFHILPHICCCKMRSKLGKMTPLMIKQD